jgi:hypothetical protein
MRALLASALTLAAASAAPSSCCAFGGNGAATLLGTAIINVAPQATTENQAMSILLALDPNPEDSVVIAALNSTDTTSPVETSTAGWMITGNSTSQTMFTWRYVDGRISCTTASAPAPERYVQSFVLCAGVAGSMFENYVSSSTYGSTNVNVYQQDAPGYSYGYFAEEALGCMPNYILSPNSPFGSGAMSFNLFGGSATAPPQNWKQPPKACGY